MDLASMLEPDPFCVCSALTPRFWILAPNFWILTPKSWILTPESWILNPGPFGFSKQVRLYYRQQHSLSYTHTTSLFFRGLSLSYTYSLSLGGELAGMLAPDLFSLRQQVRALSLPLSCSHTHSLTLSLSLFSSLSLAHTLDSREPG